MTYNLSTARGILVNSAVSLALLQACDRDARTVLESQGNLASTTDSEVSDVTSLSETASHSQNASSDSGHTSAAEPGNGAPDTTSLSTPDDTASTSESTNPADPAATTDGTDVASSGVTDTDDGENGATTSFPSDEEAPVRNTRLEAQQLETEGAPGQPLAGIWDTKEQVFCKFVTAEDGKHRCLPEAPSLLSSYGIYADADCKQELHFLGDNTGDVPPQRPWARSLPKPDNASADCEPTRFQALRPVADDTPMFRTEGGVCYPVDPTETQSFASQLKLVADTPERWESATESVRAQLSDRLRLMELRTEDGARFPTRIVDERWAASCTVLRPTEDGTLECRLPTAYGRSGYSDDTCSGELVGVPRCEQATFFEYNLERYALGELYSGSVYGGEKGCAFLGTANADPDHPDTYRLYRVGALLEGDAGALATARQGATGTGRLRPVGFLDDHDQVVLSDLMYLGPTYFDTTANENCTAVWSKDGQVRCVPESIPLLRGGAWYYTNDTCTRVAYYCSNSEGCANQKVMFVEWDAFGHNVATVGYATAVMQESTDLYANDNLGCRLVGTGVKDMAVPLSEFSLDEFPALSERHPF